MPMPVDVQKIKRLRENLNLTMDEAAKLAGWGGKQDWYAVEGGQRKNVTVDTLERVAAVLGVKAKTLLK